MKDFVLKLDEMELRRIASDEARRADFGIGSVFPMRVPTFQGRRDNVKLAPEPYHKPFDILSATVDGITLENIWFLRGPVWQEQTGTLYLALGSGTSRNLSAKINTQSHEVVLATTFDTTVLADDDEFIHIPLFKLTRDSDTVPWRVAYDLRGSAVVQYS